MPTSSAVAAPRLAASGHHTATSLLPAYAATVPQFAAAVPLASRSCSPGLSGGLPLLRSMPPLAFCGARERLLLVQSPPSIPATRTGGPLPGQTSAALLA